MSKKKVDKFKDFKRKTIWPRIVGMIFMDIGILCITGFLTYISIAGLLGSELLNNKIDNQKIISFVDENWKGSNYSNFDSKINAFRENSQYIQDVYILNSDFEIAAAYGEKISDIKSQIDFNDAKKYLNKDEIYRTLQKTEDGTHFELNAVSILVGKNSFKQFGAFFNRKQESRYVKWAEKTVQTERYWSFYKSKIPGVYVGIRNIYTINNYQVSFFTLFVIIFFIIFLVCIIYQIIRLFIFIGESVKLDLFISTDLITGGKNKNWFTDKARKRIRHSRKNYTVVQIRMEKYRNYCTSYGLKEGENLLGLFNNLFEQLMTKRKEFVAHLEKADFVFLLMYESEEELNERINSIMNRLTLLKDDQHLSFAAGVVKVSSRDADINTLLIESGLAVGLAEDSSSKIVWFNDAMKDEQIWERHIEDDMDAALSRHEFQLYLQPKYSTKTEKLAAAEALVRWNHPELGFISPGRFIPIFENNGFILRLDDFMLMEVAKQQAKWMAEGKQLVPISVNVSRAHFTRDDLAEHICEIVDRYKVPHKYIELELTESAFFDDKEVLLNTVKKLKSYGFAISMDDFGAGYSSLNSLKELPLDVIKLDAEFFRSVDDKNRARFIVAFTIALAKRLGMQIVAEGIETREQVDFLASQNCDLIQGFYFAKPLPIKEFEQKAYPEN